MSDNKKRTKKPIKKNSSAPKAIRNTSKRPKKAEIQIPEKKKRLQPLPELSTKEIMKLKGDAHRLKPVVQVGDSGVTPGVIDAVKDALEIHSLIKVKMRAPEDKKAMAEELAKKSHAILCGLTGHVVILYRPFPSK
jgi:RNA-binding protein